MTSPPAPYKDCTDPSPIWLAMLAPRQARRQRFKKWKVVHLCAAVLGIGAGFALGLDSDTGTARIPVETASLRVASALASSMRRSQPTYPVKVSTNGRYLVDQNNDPFLLVGDSPQTVIGKMSETDMKFYIANRQRYGVNALWVHVMCGQNETCNADASTPDGIIPFLTPGDLGTPNPAYFQRVDDLLNIAAAHAITILLTPAETSGWLHALKDNGPQKAFEYGQYLGERYKDFPNLIWMHGNDFQTWRDPKDDDVVLAVARGIASADHKHIQTTELNYLNSASMDDPAWEHLIQLNGVYSYYPTYAQILNEYNRKNFKPIFLEEANYEFEHTENTDGGLLNLRHQEYWAMLSGGSGQLYGSHVTWTLPSDWKLMLDTKGILQLQDMKSFFEQRAWQDLIPDQRHTIVIAGYGTPSPVGTGSITDDTYATTAATADSRLLISYLPSLREISVDMSKLNGIVKGRWFDPTSGTYFNIANGSSLPNTGISKFLPPGKNHDGDEDWVLVLEAD